MKKKRQKRRRVAPKDTDLEADTAATVTSRQGSLQDLDSLPSPGLEQTEGQQDVTILVGGEEYAGSVDEDLQLVNVDSGDEVPLDAPEMEGAIVEAELEEDVDDEEDEDMAEEEALKAACAAMVEVRRDEWLQEALERRRQAQQLQQSSLQDNKKTSSEEDQQHDGEESPKHEGSEGSQAGEVAGEGAEGSDHASQATAVEEPAQPPPSNVEVSGLQTNARLRNFLAGDGAVYAHALLENVLPDRGGPPESPPAAYTGELPANWEMAFTPRGATPYFWNKKTGASQWEFPRPKKKRRASDEDLEDFGPHVEVLPEGWIKRWSPATGKFYYENRARRLVQHERPEATTSSPKGKRERSARERVVVVKPPTQPNSPVLGVGK